MHVATLSWSSLGGGSGGWGVAMTFLIVCSLMVHLHEVTYMHDWPKTMPGCPEVETNQMTSRDETNHRIFC